MKRRATLCSDRSGDACEAARKRAEDDVGAAVGADGAIDVGAFVRNRSRRVAFKGELASLAVDAECAAGVGVGANRRIAVSASRPIAAVFAAQGEGEADW